MFRKALALGCDQREWFYVRYSKIFWEGRQDVKGLQYFARKFGISLVARE